MRVLYYSHSSTLYGAPTSLVDLIEGIRKIRPEIEIMIILPSAGELITMLEFFNIPFKIIPHFQWSYNYWIFLRKKKSNAVLSYLWLFKNVLTRTIKNLYFLPYHTRYCRRFNPDLIYVNSSLAPIGALVGLLQRRKILWHHRETINDPETGFFLD